MVLEVFKNIESKSPYQTPYYYVTIKRIALKDALWKTDAWYGWSNLGVWIEYRTN